ncbi:MAG: hypothetical protein WC130_03640 [Kiritimatiellia bacterium]
MIFPPRFNGRQRGGLFSGRNGTFNGADGSFSRRWQDGAAAGDAGSPYLDGVLASTVFDLDATQAASYPGTGTTWANLIAAPADGSAQTDYDFFRGNGATSTTYPTFTGTPGDAAAYWSFDGGDRFQKKDGTNTTFLNALHKTTGGTPWWMAYTYRVINVAPTQIVYSTQTTSTNVGIRGGTSSSETNFFVQRGDTSQGATNFGSLTPGTDYVVIISYDGSGNIARWENTTTGTAAAITFNSTSADASQALFIGAGPGTGTPLANTARMYSFAMGNEYLDDTKAAAIIAHLEARHQRNYTP